MSDKIDAVVLWVDDQDVEWQKDRAFYKNQEFITPDAGENRYRDWGIFKYWFRGIEKNAPWVNKIYLVTCGHVPQWLDINHPKIVVVKHEDFMPKEYLPTFSSHSIELNLHRIEGLSDKFIYFNDDMFVMNESKKEDFFKNEMPCYVVGLDVVVPEIGASCVDYVKLNNMNVLNKYADKNKMLKSDFGKWFNLKYGKVLIKTLLLLPWKNITGIYEAHQPTPFIKSTFDEMWELEYEILHKTCLNKFRENSDVNQWLLKNWQTVNGNFKPYSVKNYSYYELRENNYTLYKQIDKYKLICINDSSEPIGYEMAKENIRQILETKFPCKSDYELE